MLELETGFCNRPVDIGVPDADRTVFKRQFHKGPHILFV